MLGQTAPKFGEGHNYLTFKSKYIFMIFTDVGVAEITKLTKISNFIVTQRGLT